MTTTLATLAVAVALAGSVAAQQDEYDALPEFRAFGTPASEADARAIADLMERFSKAWGSEDVDALLATYTEDVEWTNAFGVVRRGHEELGSFLGEMFQYFNDAGLAAGESSSRGELSIRYLGADTAVVHNTTESSRGENRDGEGARRIHITYVLAKQDGEWRIVHQMIMDARR